MSLYRIRPIRLSDLDELENLIALSKDPVASLPNDKDLLAKRIQLSVESFSKKVTEPGKEFYFFALEDITQKRIIGVSGIEARAGGGDYFFVYEIEKEKFIHEPLNIAKTVEVLRLKTIKKGPSELCSLYLSPEFRVHGFGALLSLSRYFFINIFPERFSSEIIANLRGFRDDIGHSPFWEVLGNVFFEGSLSTVDTMKSLGHKSFIRDLMPRHPIYIPLLPKAAQEVIGRVHKETEPALHLLKKQGFKVGKWIDIFDAGPLVFAKCKKLKIIKNMRKAKVGKIVFKQDKVTNDYIIAKDSIDFRVCIGGFIENSKEVVSIDFVMADVLELKEGDWISYAKYS